MQARGSLAESINHLIDALDETYINTEKLNYYKQIGKEIEKFLNGYMNYLRKLRDKK
ncbi:MAG: hypothetical protein IPF72_05480 [Chitinophagaceae bacterium]|nr:hypothetical protein [Chitinophagaceae bacterium]